MRHTVTLVLERETKGAARYQEIDDQGSPRDIANAVIGTLYLRKSKMPNPLPSQITVHVEAG